MRGFGFWRRRRDAFSEWAAERLIIDGAAVTPSPDLWADFQAWCARRGLAPQLSITAFSLALSDRRIIFAGFDGKIKLRRGARLVVAPVSPKSSCAAAAIAAFRAANPDWRSRPFRSKSFEFQAAAPIPATVDRPTMSELRHHLAAGHDLIDEYAVRDPRPRGFRAWAAMVVRGWQ